MTIETATPSSAETIAALFDHLVEAVAQRVLAKLNVRNRTEAALRAAPRVPALPAAASAVAAGEVPAGTA